MSGLQCDYSELTKNWRLLLAALVGSAVGFPTLPFFSIGAFTPIFHDAFGWSQAAMLGGLMLASLMILVCGPFVGAFIDRKGPRLVTVASLVGLGLSYMGLAAVNGSMKAYYAAWVAMCVTGLGASAISFTRVINSMFVARRGLALGIALSGSGVFAIGAGGGPALLGRAYELAGSYTTGLWICAAALVVSGACLLLLGPYPSQFSTRSEENDAQARGEGRCDHGLVAWDRPRNR